MNTQRQGLRPADTGAPGDKATAGGPARAALPRWVGGCGDWDGELSRDWVPDSRGCSRASGSSLARSREPVLSPRGLGATSGCTPVRPLGAASSTVPVPPRNFGIPATSGARTARRVSPRLIALQGRGHGDPVLTSHTEPTSARSVVRRKPLPPATAGGSGSRPGGPFTCAPYRPGRPVQAWFSGWRVGDTGELRAKTWLLGAAGAGCRGDTGRSGDKGRSSQGQHQRSADGPC